MDPLFIIGGIAGALYLNGRVKRRREAREEKQQAEEEARRQEELSHSLQGIVASVFVRQPNGSRTNIEHHLEEALIERGADVISADQSAGMKILKEGIFEQISGAHIMLVGTLRIEEIVIEEEEYTESEYDFKIRESVWRAEIEKWKGGMYHWEYPKPVLKERGVRSIKVSGVLLQLCFRIFSSTGSVLLSGTQERTVRKESAREEKALKKLATDALQYLDEKNVWDKVRIDA